jgi:DNA-binding HxlR family transcriptional regulator
MTKQVGCPTEITLDVIAGRWKVMVIFWLLQGKRRFNQLQRDLSGITHRTLAKQLKEMEADGLVEREDFGENPPRVEYRLTPRVTCRQEQAVAGASQASLPILAGCLTYLICAVNPPSACARNLARA